MKIPRLVPLIFLAAGFALVAEEDTELSGWMKVSNNAVENLKKMEKLAGEPAVRNAERLGVVFENMVGFWRQRNMNDAVKWSQQGKAAALELATAAYAGDADKAAEAFKAVNATCDSCHEAHREKIVIEKYRIK
jgi:cytochrome c553